jgi:hypothetical protein
MMIAQTLVSAVAKVDAILVLCVQPVLN